MKDGVPKLGKRVKISKLPTPLTVICRAAGGADAEDAEQQRQQEEQSSAEIRYRPFKGERPIPLSKGISTSYGLSVSSALMARCNPANIAHTESIVDLTEPADSRSFITLVEE
jgi:hypothetical protein